MIGLERPERFEPFRAARYAVRSSKLILAYEYTVEFHLKVGFMKEPVAYDKLFGHRFVDRVLKESGRK